MLSRFLDIVPAFSLGMTADDVLVALALAEEGRDNKTGRRVCRAASQLVLDMVEGSRLCGWGEFSAAPESVRKVRLFNYALLAFREAGAVPREAGDFTTTLLGVRETLSNIAGGRPVGDAELTRKFFVALSSVSSDEIGGIMVGRPRPPDGGGPAAKDWEASDSPAVVDSGAPHPGDRPS